MVLAEALGPDGFRERVKIYATDVDEEALDAGAPRDLRRRSRRGVRRPAREVLRPRRRRLRRSTRTCGGRSSSAATTSSRTRRSRASTCCVCRNTLMYFNAETQARILARFHFAPERRRLPVPRQGRDAAHARRPVQPGRPQAPHLRQGAQGRSARAHRCVPRAPRHETAERHEPTRARLRDAAFDASPIAQIVVDRDGHAGHAPTSAARTLFGLTPQRPRPSASGPRALVPAGRAALAASSRPGRAPARHRHGRRVAAPSGEHAYLDVQVDAAGRSTAALCSGVSITFTDVTRAPALQDELAALAPGARDRLRGAAVHQRGARDHQRGAAVHGRGARDDQRGAAVDQRRARDDERGAAVHQRRAADDQRASCATAASELNRVNAFLESILTSLRAAWWSSTASCAVQVVEPPSRGPVGPARRRGEGKNFLNLDIGLPTEQLRQPISQVPYRGSLR